MVSPQALVSLEVTFDYNHPSKSAIKMDSRRAFNYSGEDNFFYLGLTTVYNLFLGAESKSDLSFLYHVKFLNSRIPSSWTYPYRILMVLTYWELHTPFTALAEDESSQNQLAKVTPVNWGGFGLSGGEAVQEKTACNFGISKKKSNTTEVFFKLFFSVIYVTL